MPPTKIDIITQVLGDVRWVSQNEGFCQCPGWRFHSKHNSSKDCKIWVEPIVTVHCFHASCQSEIARVNKQIRRGIFFANRGGDFKKRAMSPEEIVMIAKKREKEMLIIQSRSFAKRMFSLKETRTDLDQLTLSSPVCVSNLSPREMFFKMLWLFEKDEVLWMGNITDGNKKKSFRTTMDWYSENQAPANFICPNTFKFGSESRSNANIETKKYLVLESDVLGKEQMATLILWLHTHLQLVAVIDSGGKSLHGWFRYPDDKTLETLKIMLPEMGCDKKVFTPSQPVRLAGADRNGKIQKLLWLSREGV